MRTTSAVNSVSVEASLTPSVHSFSQSSRRNPSILAFLLWGREQHLLHGLLAFPEAGQADLKDATPHVDPLVADLDPVRVGDGQHHGMAAVALKANNSAALAGEQQSDPGPQRQEEPPNRVRHLPRLLDLPSIHRRLH